MAEIVDSHGWPQFDGICPKTNLPVKFVDTAELFLDCCQDIFGFKSQNPVPFRGNLHMSNNRDLFCGFQDGSGAPFSQIPNALAPNDMWWSLFHAVAHFITGPEHNDAFYEKLYEVRGWFDKFLTGPMPLTDLTLAVRCENFRDSLIPKA